MATKKQKMRAPANCRTADQVCELVRDNISTPKSWILLDGADGVTIPAEQKLTMTLEHTSPFISATTLGETISNMSKLLGAVADEIGGKVAVMVESCVLEQGKATINFVITSVKP